MRALTARLPFFFLRLGVLLALLLFWDDRGLDPAFALLGVALFAAALFDFVQQISSARPVPPCPRAAPHHQKRQGGRAPSPPLG